MASLNHLDQEYENSVVVSNVDFGYSDNYGRVKPVLHGLDFNLQPGACCLLLGANGAGKSTLLRLLAGKHMHEKEKVVVLGRPAFYQTLGISGINFLGGGWTKTVAFAGTGIPVQADIEVGEMCLHLQNEYPERRDALMEILEIDPKWRMHQVSDGQRRRVQIMLGLVRPFKLLLLDEITVDLDVVARADFLKFLKDEAANGATIVYATHIFDGMETWPTDLLLLEEGRMVRHTEYGKVRQEPGFRSLYFFIETFLREMQLKRRAKMKAEREELLRNPPVKKVVIVKPFADRVDPGFASGRMAAYMSTNR